MSVVSHRLSIAMDGQRISADNIYAPAAIHMNALKTGMFSNKSSGKQSQDLGLGNIAYQTDIQKPVLIPGTGAKSYPASFLLHVHSRQEVETGQPVDLFFIDPDRYRAALIFQQQLQSYIDISEFTQAEYV